MIKGLKLFLAQRRISNSNKSSSGELKMPISSAAIVLDSSNIQALPILMRIKQELNLKDSDFKVVLYKRGEENFPEFDGLTFVDEDVSFFGSLKNRELMDFAKNRIDLLITFAEVSFVPVSLITGTSIACLKIGNDPNSEKILDVVIRSGNDAEVFTSELIKFLKQFKNN